MSDELDIRSGGVVAVDPATLRTAADGYARLEREIAEARDVVRCVVMRLSEIAPIAYESTDTAERLAGRVDAASADARSFADRLRFAAAVYEIVELRAAATVAGGSLGIADDAEIEGRIRALSDAHPWAAAIATLREGGRRASWPLDLVAQGFGAWPIHAIAGGMPFMPATAIAFAFGIAAVGTGTIPSDARLAPASVPVRVVPLAPPLPATPPTTLAEAAARIPGGGGPERVRVERYTMPDGSRQYAVYVAGTQSAAPGTPDPFDMESNLELYTGTRSASYEATVTALQQSGAQPGDVVHAFGHSQGAMVTAHLALDGGYDTRTLVSFGSPVEADVGDGTLSIAVRHSDDPVAALEGGGHAQGVGAPGSFVAERVADPGMGPRDLRLPAHGISAYTETARMLDASVDPRMAPMRGLFDGLGSAASVDVVEYSARRLSDSGGGGG